MDKFLSNFRLVLLVIILFTIAFATFLAFSFPNERGVVVAYATINFIIFITVFLYKNKRDNK